GTAYGRSAINVLDKYMGAQELGMYMKKSKVYRGDEIKAMTEEFHRVRPAQMEGWVERLHDDMLERLIKDERPGIDPEGIKEFIASTKTGMKQHREYQSKALKDAGDAEW
ncbi:hypothetical protein, partial [Pseudomonas sp. 2(2015)]|uniref:hypothetical protein n=1 Tax=Pseudomonas sp. 2(2015) TaxID=1619950 RepID=UPI0015A54BFD